MNKSSLKRFNHYYKSEDKEDRKSKYKHWLDYYQKQIDEAVLPPENDWYISESIKDRFGNELHIGDIIIVSGICGFQEYFINKISEYSVMRIPISANNNQLVPSFRYWKDSSFTANCGHFVNYNFDFIIIKEDYLSNQGKDSLEELRKHKWFRDDYMQRCNRKMYSNW